MEGRWSRLEQGQRHGVIGFEAGRELIDQPRLARNQTFLIARERFQLLDQGALRPQPPQISEVTTAGSRQQISLDSIRFGSCGFAMTIDRFGIDRVDGKAGLQQSGDQQSMAGFNNACQFLLPFWCSDDAKPRGWSVGPSLRPCAPLAWLPLAAPAHPGRPRHDAHRPNRCQRTTWAAPFDTQRVLEERGLIHQCSQHNTQSSLCSRRVAREGRSVQNGRAVGIHQPFLSHRYPIGTGSLSGPIRKVCFKYRV